MNRHRRILGLAIALLLASSSVAVGAAETVPIETAPIESIGPNLEPIPLATDMPTDDAAYYAADSVTTASSGTLTIEGRGWGHGRGLSQYGSLGYALDGWSHSQILDHYYGGTSAGTNANDQMLIHITALSGSATMVRSDADFLVGGVPISAGSTVKVDRLSNSSFRISSSPDICGGTFTQLADVAGNEDLRPRYNNTGAERFYLEITPAIDPEDDVRNMLQTCKDGNRFRSYRGSLWALLVDGDADTLNSVPLESYVQGVVPRESPAYWGGLGGGQGIEALRSQAVAARSYALALAQIRLNSSTNYVSDACDTTSCQVYIGAGEWQLANYWKPLDTIGTDPDPARQVPANAYSEQATLDTAGEVRVWPSGDVALTEFASSTGGYTSPTSELNPFGAVPDDGDSTPSNTRHTWTREIKYSDIEAAYPSIGVFESINVTARNGLGTWGGRTREIKITGSADSVTVSSRWWSEDSFRTKFKLYSDWYRFPEFESQGFWLVRPNGEVSGYGGALDLGDMAGQPLNLPVVGMASTTTGFGYWLVATDGGIFSFGDAEFYGSTGNIVLNEPIVAMAAHPDGGGYWFVASDGGVFSYGNSEFYGSMGGTKLVSPVVGMAATSTGKGYWLVAADGGIFAFGDAQFYGSIGGQVLANPIRGMAVHPDGNGYWFVSTTGTIYAYGSAEIFGPQVSGQNVVGMAARSDGTGYWIVRSDALSYTRPFVLSLDYPTSSWEAPVIGIARQN